MIIGDDADNNADNDGDDDSKHTASVMGFK